jgi:uncharacterized YigZ family protein
MPPPTRYPVPAGTHRAELEVSRSRFIATLAPAPTPAAAEALRRLVREEFPGATHHAWAYVAGPPGSTTHVGTDDDGEVRGTAGRPMLSVLLHSGIGDVAAVVTRFYGGTKLGTGGLVRAYGGSLQLALQTLPLTERVEYAPPLTVVVSYADTPALRHLFAEHEVEVLGESYADAVTYELRVPAGAAAQLRGALLDATRGQARIAEGTAPEAPEHPGRAARPGDGRR